MKSKIHYFLVAVFIILCSSITYRWYTKKINFPTGDEPHYLIMTDGLLKYGSFEQTRPYQDHYKEQKFFKTSDKPNDKLIAKVNCHAVKGSHGFYNMHNIGLPVLLLIPYYLGGMTGIRFFMICFASILVYIAFKWALNVSKNTFDSFWIAFLCCFSAGFVPASGQIFPDLPAGVLCLMGLYWIFLIQEKKSTLFTNIILSMGIAYLPWLHLKLALPSCLILLTALFLLAQERKWRNIWPISCIAGVLYTGILLYTHYAYDRWTGPFESIDHALHFNMTTPMIFLGLIADQNQGLLFQNIFFLAGFIGIGYFFQKNFLLASLWLMVFLSLIVPNSLHPVTYGGWCFMGRFALSAACVFIVPTIFGLIRIFHALKSLKGILVPLSGISVHAYYFYFYAKKGIHLYQKDWQTIPELYSTYYPRALSRYLPMFYNPEWFYRYKPNYVWLMILTSLICSGFLLAYYANKKAKYTEREA